MANDRTKDRPQRAAANGDSGRADKREIEPHRLLQDKPEGSRETIERELKRQEDKGRSKAPGHSDRRPS